MTRTRLVEEGRDEQPAFVLAVSRKNCGYAYLAQGKMDAAAVEFEKAVEIYDGLVRHQGQVDLSGQFAKTLAP